MDKLWLDKLGKLILFKYRYLWKIILNILNDLSDIDTDVVIM